jgi:dihydroorotase
METETLTFTQPDDWHIHLRDGNKLVRTVGDAARQFQRAIVMPNLVPAIDTVEDALAYRERILQHIPKNCNFEPLMTLYLTDKMSIDTIKKAAASPYIHAIKLYPAGATTNSSQGVTDFADLYPLFAAMEEHQLPLLIHGEVTHSDIFDREALFIEQILMPLRESFPQLKIVLEHITTAAAVDFVMNANEYTAATITPHHLLFDRNQLLVGGIKPDYYCLPILKRAEDRQALIAAATSGNSRFFLGTDSAPHSINSKYSACGCAGIYSAYCAIELYAHVFEQANALDKLEAFASFYGPDFYGLPHNTQQISLQKKTNLIPEKLAFGKEEVIPLWAGKTLNWKIL